LISQFRFIGPTTTTGGPSSRFFPRDLGRFRIGSLAPPVEMRVVARIPGLTESRSAQIPVGAALARHGSQVVPEVYDRWAAPEPVAVVDTVNQETGLEHERVRNHRVVLRVSVFLDVEVLLHLSIRVRKKGPLGADGRTELLKGEIVAIWV